MHAIGVREASERTGLSAHTLRYYERAGLIGPVRREASGKRTYSEKDLLWLAFLRRLRATGMSVAQMRQFATLRAAGDATTGDRRRLLEVHAEFIRGQIDTLAENLEIVERKIEHFRQEERDATTVAGRITLRRPRRQATVKNVSVRSQP